MRKRIYGKNPIVGRRAVEVRGADRVGGRIIDGRGLEPGFSFLISLVGSSAILYLYKAYHHICNNEVVPEEIVDELGQLNIPIGRVVPLVEDIEANVNIDELPVAVAQEIREAQAVPFARVVTGRRR